MSEALREFEALPKSEQSALAVLAAAGRPLNRTNWADLLRTADVVSDQGRPISTSALTGHTAKWSALGLIQRFGNGESYRIVPPLLHALLAQVAQRGDLARIAAPLRLAAPLQGRYGAVLMEAFGREVLLSLHLPGGAAELQDACKRVTHYSSHDIGELLLDAIGTHVPAPLLERLGVELAERYLLRLCESALLNLTGIGEGPLTYVREVGDVLVPEVRAFAIAYLALRGAHAQAAAFGGGTEPAVRAAQCLLALSRGELTQARSEASAALEATRTKKSNKLKGLKGYLGYWVTLALLTDPDPRSVTLARAQLEAVRRSHPACDTLHTALLMLSQALQLETRVPMRLSDYAHLMRRWDEQLFWRTLCQVAQEPVSARLIELARAEGKGAMARGFTWVAAELAALETADGLGRLVVLEEPWQRALRALDAALDQVAPEVPVVPASKTSKERLVWCLTPSSDAGFHVSARVQTALQNGWSSGRQLTWRKVAEANADCGWLSEQDVPAVKQVLPPDTRSFRYSHAPSATLPLALIGHPRVFIDPEARQPVEVVRGAVRIEVTSKEDQLLIALSPRACQEHEVACESDGRGRIVVYALTDAQRKIAEQLGRRGLALPEQAKEAAQRVLARLVAHFPVQSDLGIDSDHLQQVEADARIHVDLARTASGLRLRLFVAPIGAEQTFVPGAGSASVLGTIEGEAGLTSVRAQRDLPEEERRLSRLLEECPSLAPDTRLEQRVDDLERCLELLSELRAATDIVLVWSEGEPLTIASERGVRDVRVTLRTVESWLAADGEIEVDELAKLRFRALLDAKRRRGRFLLLDDGRYLALTQELARTLDLVEPLAEEQDDELKLHPLSLLQFAALEPEQLEIDHATEALLGRVREADARMPKVPPAFEATLRPYQEEGYAWLSRLAHWGGGACLADDMGLGKTLQALALLVEHAAQGPALVVAPTSVCGNWMNEARRFAPTLRVVQLAGEREQVLGKLGPYDVLVCSYGLLQQEIDRLANVRFQVAILDEAQAIKNPATLRTKAALRISAHARVALTGTPLENHLGDLHSLMRFLNPGLLGTSQRFEARFAKPMQRDGDRAAGHLLRRLIKPFILRRKKSEVLDDLPPKTVITLRIEPSAEERALYGALREKALEKLATSGPNAQARIQVLAELTRLRRAACHPQLVVPDHAVESSKLSAFLDLVDELREGGHRALVFSQFVDHLTLVRTQLDAREIAYQYLDGSATPRAREQAVAAFRAGQGDLFLISLKAGGFGLNLTAADYVVHLDPWWNPAVEDQASDRAHRIGQQRPVTVYRLVVRGSIEEKILALHDDKRELADALLEGTSSATSLSVDQLTSLLRDAGA